MREKIYKKIFIIGLSAVVTVLAVVIAMVVWSAQIRLTTPNNVIVGEIDMHSVHVNWDAVEHATSYGVFVYEVDEEQPIKYQQTDKAEIEITGLYENYSYTISVVACYDKEEKHIESEPSEKISVQTLSPELGMAENVQATATSSTSIVVHWTPYQTKDTNADGTNVKVLYTVQCSVEENGTYTTLAENIEGTEYVHEGLTELDCYYYKVIVQEQMDDSIYIGKESEISAFAITGIGTVSGLKAEGISSSEIEISWKPYEIEKTNKDGTPVNIWYTLYGANSENEEFVILADKIAETSYKEVNLPAEKTRFYKVATIVQRDECEVVGEQTALVSAKTQAKKTTTTSGSGNKNSQSSVNAEKEAQARVVAQQIADSITGNNDLEKVRQAAEIIAVYCMNSTYTSSDPDYRTPYGLLCKGVYTCAGATRALGLVLECMGYSWEHVNENQWTHQWCKVTMDGKVGWADGMGGIADYGECPFATGEPYIDENGMIYFIP